MNNTPFRVNAAKGWVKRLDGKCQEWDEQKPLTILIAVAFILRIVTHTQQIYWQEIGMTSCKDAINKTLLNEKIHNFGQRCVPNEYSTGIPTRELLL